MNILFIGDIVGKCGRNVITKHLEEIKKKYDIDFTIANGENVTHGRGLIEKHYEDLLSAGVDLVTLGNHYRSKDEIDHYIDNASQLIRPNNLLNYRLGEGYAIMDVDGVGVKVINILGDAFIAEAVSSPFLSIKEALKADEEVTINIVDYHAESTSEKETMGYAFDGELTALIGTHTHVQTNDARILPNGTGFMCDAGFCGEYESILGVERNSVINKFVYGKKVNFQYADSATSIIGGVVIKADEITGKCIDIFPIKLIYKE